MPKKSIARLALGLGAVLLLSACSAPQQAPAVPQDDTHRSATAQPSQAPSGQATPSAEQLSPSELSVTAGAVLAAQLGFPNSAKITGDDLKALATKPTDTLKDIVVLPGSCAAPVEDLNWSPLQLGTAGARTDITNQAQSITGSVEVAPLRGADDRKQVEQHYANVTQILEDCRNVKINGLDYAETLKFSDPKVESVDSALYYTRDGQYAQDSLVLLSKTEDYAVMVSFVSAAPLDDPQFATVATSIMQAALAQLQ